MASSETRLCLGQDAFQPRDRIPRTPAKTEPSGKNGVIVLSVVKCERHSGSTSDEITFNTKRFSSLLQNASLSFRKLYLLWTIFQFILGCFVL